MIEVSSGNTITGLRLQKMIEISAGNVLTGLQPQWMRKMSSGNALTGESNNREWRMFSFVFPRAHLHVAGTLSLPTLFFLFCSCVCFCLYGPFNCISFHELSRQLSNFSLCSPGLISAVLVLSAIYFFVKVSLSPDVILCGWLGLKHLLTN